jgi:hypothetical protein
MTPEEYILKHVLNEDRALQNQQITITFQEMATVMRGYAEAFYRAKIKQDEYEERQHSNTGDRHSGWSV